MEEQPLTSRLIELLREASQTYAVLNGVMDIENPNVPVTDGDAELLLSTYLAIYGQNENRHGGFNSAETYEKFMDSAKMIRELPEVKGIEVRIEKARANLELAIRTLKPEQVSGRGYELRERSGRLLVFRKDNY